MTGNAQLKESLRVTRIGLAVADSETQLAVWNVSPETADFGSDLISLNGRGNRPLENEDGFASYRSVVLIAKLRSGGSQVTREITPREEIKRSRTDWCNHI